MQARSGAGSRRRSNTASASGEQQFGEQPGAGAGVGDDVAGTEAAGAAQEVEQRGRVPGAEAGVACGILAAMLRSSPLRGSGG